MVVLIDPSADHARRRGEVLGKTRLAERQYMFDTAFGADSTQDEVYLKTTKPLVQAVLDG